MLRHWNAQGAEPARGRRVVVGISDSGVLGQGWGIFISSRFVEDAETLPVLEPLFKAEGTPAEALRQERAWWVQGLEMSPVWLGDKEQGAVDVGTGHAMR